MQVDRRLELVEIVSRELPRFEEVSKEGDLRRRVMELVDPVLKWTIGEEGSREEEVEVELPASLRLSRRLQELWCEEPECQKELYSLFAAWNAINNACQGGETQAVEKRDARTFLKMANVGEKSPCFEVATEMWRYIEDADGWSLGEDFGIKQSEEVLGDSLSRLTKVAADLEDRLPDDELVGRFAEILREGLEEEPCDFELLIDRLQHLQNKLRERVLEDYSKGKESPSDALRHFLYGAVLLPIGIAQHFQLAIRHRKVLKSKRPEHGKVVVCMLRALLCTKGLAERLKLVSGLIEKENNRQLVAYGDTCREALRALQLRLKFIWCHGGAAFLQPKRDARLLDCMREVKNLRASFRNSTDLLAIKSAACAKTKDVKAGRIRVWRLLRGADAHYRALAGGALAELELLLTRDRSNKAYEELLAEAAAKPVRRRRRPPPPPKVVRVVKKKVPQRRKGRKKGKARPVKQTVRVAEKVEVPLAVESCGLLIGDLKVLGKGRQARTLGVMLEKLRARLLVKREASVDYSLGTLDLLRRTLEAALGAALEMEGKLKDDELKRTHELAPRAKALLKSKVAPVIKCYLPLLARLSAAYPFLHYGARARHVHPGREDPSVKKLCTFIDRCERGEKVGDELRADYVQPTLNFVEALLASLQGEKVELPEAEEFELPADEKVKVEVKLQPRKGQPPKRKLDAYDPQEAHRGIVGLLNLLDARLEGVVLPGLRGRRRDEALAHVRRSLERILDKLSVKDPTLDIHSSCDELLDLTHRAAKEALVALMFNKEMGNVPRFENDVIQLAGLVDWKGHCPTWLGKCHASLSYPSIVKSELVDSLQSMGKNVYSVRVVNQEGKFGPWGPPNCSNVSLYKERVEERIEDLRAVYVWPALQFVSEVLLAL